MLSRAVIRRHWGAGHEASEFLGEELHGVVDLRRRHRDPLHPRQVVPVVARQQGRRDLGLLPEIVAAVAVVVVVELGVDVEELEGEGASLRWEAPRMMRVERRSVILPITAVAISPPSWEVGWDSFVLCARTVIAGGPRLHLVTEEHPGRGRNVILFISVLLLGVVHLRNMLGEVRGVHSGDILR